MAGKQTETAQRADAADDAPPITLAEMAYVVTRFADDHEAFQHRRVVHGWRRTLDRAEMRKVEALRKTVALIDRVIASDAARAALGLRAASPHPPPRAGEAGRPQDGGGGA